VVSGAVQQLAAGVAFLLPAMLVPEHPVRWSARGAGALMYLVVFGSIVGYSAYIYAMDKLPVAIVSIYTYVNPVVAVALGWLFYREPFGGREAVAMLVIFAGVALVKRHGPAVRRRGAEASVPGEKLCPDGAADGRQKREKDEHEQQRQEKHRGQTGGIL
jgi:drug/metabolite transporter (DMT)-like permease